MLTTKSSLLLALWAGVNYSWKINIFKVNTANTVILLIINVYSLSEVEICSNRSTSPFVKNQKWRIRLNQLNLLRKAMRFFCRFGRTLREGFVHCCMVMILFCIELHSFFFLFKAFIISSRHTECSFHYNNPSENYYVQYRVPLILSERKKNRF